MEFSSNAFLARILDNESAETLGSDSFAILGWATSAIGSLIGVGVLIAVVGFTSSISWRGTAVFSGIVTTTFSIVSTLLATSTIE